MSNQQFYLLGEATTSAKHITIDASANLDQLKHTVAAYFAIVEPNGQSDNDHAPFVINH